MGEKGKEKKLGGKCEENGRESLLFTQKLKLLFSSPFLFQPNNEGENFKIFRSFPFLSFPNKAERHGKV